jgi:hypothetical protein
MTTTTYDNSVNPSVISEIYNPDQLIAGRYPLVTAQGAVLTGGAVLPRGSVLGIAAIGAAAAAVAGVNTGNGTITAQAAGVRAKAGTYTVRFTGATAYTVVDPTGVELQPGVAAGAYNDPELSFTFTAGGTPMVAGDSFTINVPAGSGLYKLSVATATDGSQIPCGILADVTDPTGGNVGCGVYMTGEFSGDALNYDVSWSLAALTAALQASNIFVRTTNPNSQPSNYTG